MPARTRRSFAACLPFVLSFLIHCSPAAADASTWSGPDGGTVSSLALQPGSSGILYAATPGGVFKSYDGGATWLQPGEGPPFRNVVRVAVDPGRPATVYAGLAGGIHKSTDGGARWLDVGGGLPSLPFPPFRPSVGSLLVLSSGTVYLGTDLGVFRSRDGGGSWEPLNRGLPQTGPMVHALEIDPSRPRRMYAGLNRGIYRSNDGGGRWTQLRGTPEPVVDLAVSPSSPNVLYAAQSTGVIRSFDSGATWRPSGQGLAGFVTSLAVHPALSGTVYAGTSEGVFRSIDRGETWTRLDDGLSDAAVLALAIDPAHPATLWAGTLSQSRLGGVFRTTDAGAHWAFRGTGLEAVQVISLAVDPNGPDTLFAALGTAGLVRSRDRGRGWTPLAVPAGLIVWDVEVDPVDSAIVYAAVSHDGPLLRSTDGGDTWSRHGTSPPGGFGEIEIDPADPAILYGGSGASGFYKSADAGATWTRSPSADFVIPMQIAIAPGFVYAIAGWPPVHGTPGANLTQLLRSTDGGETWQVAIHIDRSPIALAVSPSAPKTVYAALRDGSILRSTDGGSAWQEVAGLSGVISLAVAPGSPETLYAAVSGQGVYRSTDGGADWTPALRGHAGLSFGEIVLDPEDPGRLYVTVDNRGVAAVHEPEPCEPAPARLCLRENRFRVEAAWTDFQGGTGTGQALPLTGETGGLWFFSPGNVELVVKVLDGFESGRHWVFVASLTSVEFTLTVTDTETGRQRTYYNPPGHMASFADTDWF